MYFSETIAKSNLLKEKQSRLKDIEYQIEQNEFKRLNTRELMDLAVKLETEIRILRISVTAVNHTKISILLGIIGTLCAISSSVFLHLNVLTISLSVILMATIIIFVIMAIRNRIQRHDMNESRDHYRNATSLLSLRHKRKGLKRSIEADLVWIILLTTNLSTLWQLSDCNSQNDSFFYLKTATSLRVQNPSIWTGFTSKH